MERGQSIQAGERQCHNLLQELRVSPLSCNYGIFRGVNDDRWGSQSLIMERLGC